MRLRAILGAAATILSCTLANAQQTTRHIDGYRCMMLNITERQSMDPQFKVVLRAAPSPTAPEAGWAAAIVVIKEPVVPQNGFLQMLKPNGQPAWIPAAMVMAYRPLSDPNAKCFPSVLANGRIGTSPR